MDRCKERKGRDEARGDDGGGGRSQVKEGG